uniref:MICOS complex subunit MIC60 n=1 Tax=Rhabditophanes sp. KR3021 TaxID=114890 RepID=A0AC35U6V6_9BILA
MKKLLVAAGVAGTAVGGTVVVASKDKAFREKVETTIPQSKSLFKAVLGDSEPVVVHRPAPKLAPVVVQKTVSQDLAPLPKKKPVDVSPVDVKSVPKVAQAPLKPVILEDASAIENARLQRKLMGALDDAQHKVQQATSSTFFTIEKIKNHTVALKTAIDNGVNGDWNAVTATMKEIEDQQAKDRNFETDALNYITSLETIIEEGKARPETARNPLLLNCKETANKMKSEMNRVKILVNREKNEINVLDNYKDLIEKSRQEFWKEVHAVAPDVDLSAVGNTLSEKELNNLLVHAHLKNEKLRNRLIEQELREQQNVARALEKQREADEVLLREKLYARIAEIEQSNAYDREAQIAKLNAEFEKGLEKRLEREKIVHSDHLEKVIRTQKQIYDIEHSEKVTEAVLAERKKHGEEFELAISQLEGIEHALDKRALLDIENRRAKQCWIACQNLLESIQYGIKSGDSVESRRKPLQKEIEVIKDSGKGDAFIETILNTFNDEALKTGVYTAQDLKNRFKTVYKVARRVAKVDENGGSLFKYLSSYVQSLFMFELGGEYSPKEKVDVNNLNTYDILERAQHFVNKGDFDNAIKLTQLLTGESRAVANSWIKDAQSFLETHFLAQLLAARSVVISACSVY